MEFRRVLFRSGLTFAEGATLGEPFTNGAFIGLHGSWNRKPLAGYKVVFVKFNEKGHPQGLPIDLLTGFLTKDDEARGRTADVLIDNAGALQTGRASGRASV